MILVGLFDMIWHMHCFEEGIQPRCGLCGTPSHAHGHGEIDPRGTQAGPAEQGATLAERWYLQSPLQPGMRDFSALRDQHAIINACMIDIYDS